MILVSDFVICEHRKEYGMEYRTQQVFFLKGRIVQPPKTGLKWTSAAAPALQQTVACMILPFNDKKTPPKLGG